MSIQLQTRVSALEAEVRLLKEQLEAFVSAADAPFPADDKKSMCPKCGVKPNKYFHVKTCKGAQ